ncbi:MAG TPA: STAS domain-containing protein [Candidatus Acidoferrales bacterium]|nr:STAS domain-containing protein [Candidatus Acidoferrales bacterium]
MVASSPTLDTRQSLAVNLEFTRGRHGASARVELHERSGARLATLALRGWIDPAAERRIEQTLDELAARGAAQLVIDCSQLRHIDYRVATALVGTLERFESHSGSVAVCGLSRYLRDLLRLAGGESHLCQWASAAAVLGAPPTGIAASGRAS